MGLSVARVCKDAGFFIAIYPTFYRIFAKKIIGKDSSKGVVFGCKNIRG